jgi:hypothetical protein
MVASKPSVTLGQTRFGFESLRNVVREPTRTCRVCAAPVRAFELCWRCREHARIAGLADVVAPLMYAIGDTASAALVRNYKNHPLRAERQRCALIISTLLRLGVSLHEGCFGALVGTPVSVRMVIPSLTSRPGTHPLTAIAELLNLLGGAALAPTLEARCDRVVRLDKFTVKPAGSVAGRHVLVVDDVWTTGSNAQSAALTLRQAGAAAVSVLLIGRWLNPQQPVSASFIADRHWRAYDPHLCPVTGARCPPRTQVRSA